MAYVLPIIQILQSRLIPKVRCLVVVPVQELATQVYKVFVTYTSHTNLKVGLLSGASIFHEEQKNILKESMLKILIYQNYTISIIYKIWINYKNL